MQAIRLIGFSALLLALGVGCGGKPTTEGPAAPPNDFKGSKAGPAGGAPKDKPAPSGIEGDYTLVDLESLGEKAPAADIAKMASEGGTVKITKDAIEIPTSPNKKETYKYKIDPTKSPPEIDTLVPEMKKGEGEKWSYGIYKVEGDTLTIFLIGAFDAKERPKQFKTLSLDPKKMKEKQRDAGVSYAVLKRKT